MLQTIAVLLGEEPISFENILDFELFDASEISVEPQRWYAKHIIKFCANRTAIAEAEFVAKLIKVADTERLTAQFGLAVLVHAELMHAEVLAALKVDVGALGPRLEKASSQTTLDFARPELPQAEREELDNDIDAAVEGLRSEFGGKRVAVPIRILTDDVLVAKVEHMVLSKPDKPPETFNDRLTGKVKRIDFGESTSCELKEQKDDGSTIKSLRRVGALIAREELIDEVIEIARKREVATFTLKRHERAGQEACIEVLSIEKCARNLLPLSPSE